ncbi:MAG: hypothetical protein AAF957_15625 [Planctomycetota bacterium]
MTCLALALCSLLSVNGTAPVPHFDASPKDHLSRVHHDASPDGTLWARGGGYKARAGASGFTFIPFLGSDAPRNFPVRMRLASTQRGTDALSVREAAGVTRSGDRIAIDRGAVRVLYDLTSDGVEQSFAIDAAEGTGDLVLTLEVETELDVTQEEGGFRFSNELGGVFYGSATVFDSTGSSSPVAATWLGDRIELTVRSSFLRAAEWPILVDPLMTPFQIATSTADLAKPDAAYDLRASRYSIVAEERFSATDSDVLTWYLTPAGVVSGAAYIDQTTDSWESPRVAVEPGFFGTTQVLAVGPSASVSGATDIVWRERFDDMSLQPPRVAVSATTEYSCAAPDVGTDGEYGQGSSQVAVYNRVYAGHRDVHSFGFCCGVTWNDRPVAANPSFDYGAPRISTTSGFYGGAFYYVAGWAARELSTGASSVQTARIRYDASSRLGPFTVAGPTAAELYFDVHVSSENLGAGGLFNPYLVAYDDRPSNVSDALIASCRGATLLGTYELQVSEHADRSPNQNDLRIIANERRYLLGYEEKGLLYMTSVESIDGELGIVERRRVVPAGNIVSGSLAATEAAPSTLGNWGGLFVWATEDTGSTTISGAFATHGTSLPPAAGVQYCYGTANSTGDRGFLMISGNTTLFLPKTLRVEALPPNVFGYYLASTTTGLVPNAGGSQGTLCVGGSIGRFGIFQADGAGTSSRTLSPTQIPQPTGPVSAMAGDRWNFQVWYRDALMGSATSNFTNAVTIPF